MILLDTHVWVWWNAAPQRLSPAARMAIAGADELGISAISCWEVAMLVSKQRLAFDREIRSWVQEALPEDLFSVLPITPLIGVTAGTLDSGFHGDPADRIIVATAMELGIKLVTKDDGIRSSAIVDTVW